MATVVARKVGKDADANRESRAAASARLKSLLDKAPLPSEVEGLSEEEIARMADDMVREVRAATRGAA